MGCLPIEAYGAPWVHWECMRPISTMGLSWGHMGNHAPMAHGYPWAMGAWFPMWPHESPMVLMGLMHSQWTHGAP